MLEVSTSSFTPSAQQTVIGAHALAKTGWNITSAEPPVFEFFDALTVRSNARSKLPLQLPNGPAVIHSEVTAPAAVPTWFCG